MKRIYKINNTDIPGLIEIYKDCFGDIPITHHMIVNPDVKSVVNPPRNIPFGTKPKLMKKLEKWG